MCLGEEGRGLVAVALSAARELGLQVLACPSTGNLANAVAAAAARAGIQSVVFVPENLVHGVVNVEAGQLIDSFTPMRTEFL